MAATPTLKNKLARQALEKFPNSSKKAIATYLFETYPLNFTSVEDARSKIRFVTGTGGEHNRAKLSKPVKHETNFTRENPFGLPESTGKDRQFVRLPKACTNVLWLSDIHFPNHDVKALTAALQYGKDNKINCVVLGGDILDNTPFTRHDAIPPDKQDAKNYFKMASDFIDTLKKLYNCPIYWIEGNHDGWYERFLMKNAPMIFEDEYFQLENRLGLKQRGVTYLKQNVILKAGKLDMLHGHTLVRGIIAPVNPARGIFLKTKSSTMIGHVHQNSYHPERNLKGEIIGCWSVGCLCTLSPLYDPHCTKHGNGFAHIKIEENGNFHVSLKEIFNGKIL